MIVRSPRAPSLRCDGLAGDGRQGLLAELQLHALHLEELLVLLDDGVLGLGQDVDQGLEPRSSKMATTGMRPTSSGIRPYLIRSWGMSSASRPEAASGADLGLGLEPDHGPAQPLGDDLVQPDEGAAADEQDVGRVDRDEFLVGMLAAALGRNVGRSSPR